MCLIEVQQSDAQFALISTSDIVAVAGTNPVRIYLKGASSRNALVVYTTESLADVRRKIRDAALEEMIRFIREEASIVESHPEVMHGLMGLLFARTKEKYWICGGATGVSRWRECEEDEWNRRVRSHAARLLLYKKMTAGSPGGLV